MAGDERKGRRRERLESEVTLRWACEDLPLTSLQSGPWLKNPADPGLLPGLSVWSTACIRASPSTYTVYHSCSGIKSLQTTPKGTVSTFYWWRECWKWHILQSLQWTAENDCGGASRAKRSAFHLQRGVLWPCTAPERTPAPGGQMSTPHQKAQPRINWKAPCYSHLSDLWVPRLSVKVDFIAGEGKKLLILPRR